MDIYRTDRIRNVVLLGHGGAGKTTLAEAMAYLAGMTNRLGRVEDGNTVSDFDKEEQKRRFCERMENPEKRWKITDEDWRNREKWDQNEEAVNEMLKKTSTTFAPWHILESVDKKYARIKALKIIIKELEKALK